MKIFWISAHSLCDYLDIYGSTETTNTPSVCCSNLQFCRSTRCFIVTETSSLCPSGLHQYCQCLRLYPTKVNVGQMHFLSTFLTLFILAWPHNCDHSGKFICFQCEFLSVYILIYKSCTIITKKLFVVE